MTGKLLQIDFRMAGPWGDDLVAACTPLAQSIANERGLVWKIWTENKQTGEAGGIYLFEDEASAEAYAAMHTERLAANGGISEIRVRMFDVNAALTKITMDERVAA